MGMHAPDARKHRGWTPLGVIALFVSLTETVLGISATQTADGIQIALIAFVVGFPLFVAGMFFAILWKKPYVLFPPDQFGSPVGLRDYVEAMQGRTSDSADLLQTIQTSIQSVLTSEAIVAALAQATSSPPDTSGATQASITHILDSAAQQTLEKIEEKGFVTIDTRPLIGMEGEVWRIPYEGSTSVLRFVTDIWFTFRDRMPPFTYGKQWAIRDAKSSKVFRDLRWERHLQEAGVSSRLPPLSSAPRVKDFGVLPGMRLEVIPIQSGTDVDEDLEAIRRMKDQAKQQGR